MFNRKIQIGLVKPPKSQDSENTPRETFAQKMNVTSFHLKAVVRNVAIAVAAFVVLDTVRQVMIENAKNPQA